MTRPMDINEIIQEMVRRIVAGFAPVQIILFGSQAEGHASADSDVDLLVVVRDASNRRALRVAMRQAVNGLGVSKDIVVLSEREFEVKRQIPGTIAFPADREGKVLYAAG